MSIIWFVLIDIKMLIAQNISHVDYLKLEISNKIVIVQEAAESWWIEKLSFCFKTTGLIRALDRSPQTHDKK